MLLIDLSEYLAGGCYFFIAQIHPYDLSIDFELPIALKVALFCSLLDDDLLV